MFVGANPTTRNGHTAQMTGRHTPKQAATRVSTARGEEVFHKAGALRGKHSGNNLALWMQGPGGKDSIATLLIGRAIDHAGHLSPTYRPCAHDTRLHCDIKCALVQVFSSQRIGTCRSRITQECVSGVTRLRTQCLNEKRQNAYYPNMFHIFTGKIHEQITALSLYKNGENRKNVYHAGIFTCFLFNPPLPNLSESVS